MSFIFTTSKEWCTEVAAALLPHMIEVLPRNRWVNSLTAFRDYAILTVHNILQRAGLRWLDKLSGKKRLEAVPRPEPGAVGGSRATLAVEAGSEGWVLSDSEQEGDRQEQPEELEEEPLGEIGFYDPEEVDFVPYNEWQQRHTEHLARSVAEAVDMSDMTITESVPVRR